MSPKRIFKLMGLGIALSIVLCLFINIGFSAEDSWYGYEYWATSDVLFEWNANWGDYYEIKIIWTDPSINEEYLLGVTIEKQMMINRPRSGHFIFMVRACKDINNCSEWASSNIENDAIVGTNARRWRVYFAVPPPTGIIIE
jgi:hypothetical protein